MICTFFGHRECPEEIYPKFYDAIETLIRQKGVRCFYVGNQGRFDDHLFEGRYTPTNAQGKREVQHGLRQNAGGSGTPPGADDR